MRFRITATVHYGYLRYPGIYDDLSEKDMAALSPYGERIPDQEPEATPPAPSSIPDADRMVRSDDRPIRTRARGKKNR